MSREEEILFGKIAVKKGYLTKDELRMALKHQNNQEEEPPIGEILLDFQLLNQEQLDEILKLQEKNLNKIDALTKEKKEEVLFGKLAIKKGFIEKDELRQLLKKQQLNEKKGRRYRLGELLVNEGYMTEEEFHNVLDQQNKRVMKCTDCSTRFNVGLPPRTEDKLACPKCNGKLRKVEEASSPAVDDSVAVPDDELLDEEQTTGTTTVHMDPEEMKTEAELKETEQKKSIKCTICSNEFKATPDKYGRVECPNCTANFSASDGLMKS